MESVLRWGVKESFRHYVLSSGGRIDLAGLAAEEGEEFLFPLESVDENSDGDRVLRFAGQVGFHAHGGGLDLRLRDPWIHQLADETWLTVEVGGDGKEGRTLLAEIGSRIPVASAGMLIWREAPSWLALEGTPVFDSIYPPYEVLSPVTFGRPEESADGAPADSELS